MLADQVTDVDATDIVVLNQEVISAGSGMYCLDVSLRVLGPTCKDDSIIACYVIQYLHWAS